LLDLRVLEGVALVEDDVSGGDRQPASVRHRVARVDHEVEEDLSELPAVDEDGLQPGLELTDDLDVLADRPVDELERLSNHVVHVRDLGQEDLLAAEREQLV